MKIAITGANGYIGSKLTKELCNEGFFPVCIDCNHNHIDSRAFFVEGNIFENDNWYERLQKPDVLLHLAWNKGFVHNSPNHMKELPGHISFLKKIVDSGIKTLAIMGTMHEIGYYEGPIDERTPCSPLSEYGKAKNILRTTMEEYCRGKCNFIYLRAFYIYGDDEFGNSIFCKITKAAREGEKFFPFTSGKNKYDFLHVDELVKQIIASITQTEVVGIINCCSGIPVSLGEMVENYIMSRKLNIKLEYGAFPDRPYDSPCVYGDTTKIKKVLDNYVKRKLSN